MVPHERTDRLGKGQIDSAHADGEKDHKPPNSGCAMKIEMEGQPLRAPPDPKTSAPLAFARPPQYQSAEGHQRHDHTHPADEWQPDRRRHGKKRMDGYEERQDGTALDDFRRSQDFQ